MHTDERPLDAARVRRLLAAQHPQWSELPLERVPSAGTDNALFRLGDDMAVRLPRIAWAVGGIARELEWLQQLAPLLQVSVPLPLAAGVATDAFDWPWSVVRWLPGETAQVGAVPPTLAADLARFVAALHRVELADGPAAGRGVPLAERDEPTRAAIAELDGTIDTTAATAAWEAALDAPPWDGPPVWIHGDLSPFNLLLGGGRLTGVIDWSGVGVGDPACDLIPAWNLLDEADRARFRAELGPDGASWARGAGWALSIAVIQLPYYGETNPQLAANARHVVNAVLTAAQ